MARNQALIEEFIAGNRRWVAETLARDPEFFTRLSGGQQPSCLWIGCSDSRVPVTQILNVGPGDVFVHRNVGNIVSPVDLNCLCTIEFAVNVLKVQDVVVCGHYGCGAVKAAVEDQRHGFTDVWLQGIRTVYDAQREKLESLDGGRRHDRMCEINVLAQVGNVCKTPILRDAWESGNRVAVHGLIYDLRDGLLRDLDVHVAGDEDLTALMERISGAGTE